MGTWVWQRMGRGMKKLLGKELSLYGFMRVPYVKAYQLYTLNTCSLFYVNDSSLQGSFKIDYSVVRIQSTWMATAKRTHYILFNMPNDPFSYPLRPYRRTEHSRSFRVSWKNERRRASHSPEIWTVWAVGGAWLSTSVPRHLLENN